MEIRGPRIWDGRPVTDEQAERILVAVLDEGYAAKCRLTAAGQTPGPA
jgi:hypothetical protein